MSQTSALKEYYAVFADLESQDQTLKRALNAAQSDSEQTLASLERDSQAQIRALTQDIEKERNELTKASRAAAEHGITPRRSDSLPGADSLTPFFHSLNQLIGVRQELERLEMAENGTKEERRLRNLAIGLAFVTLAPAIIGVFTRARSWPESGSEYFMNWWYFFAVLIACGIVFSAWATTESNAGLARVSNLARGRGGLRPVLANTLAFFISFCALVFTGFQEFLYPHEKAAFEFGEEKMETIVQIIQSDGVLFLLFPAAVSFIVAVAGCFLTRADYTSSESELMNSRGVIFGISAAGILATISGLAGTILTLILVSNVSLYAGVTPLGNTSIGILVMGLTLLCVGAGCRGAKRTI